MQLVTLQAARLVPPEQGFVPAGISELGGEESQLIDKVGAVGLAREHRRVLGHAEAHRHFPPGQQAPHRLQVEISDTRGAAENGSEAGGKEGVTTSRFRWSTCLEKTTNTVKVEQQE